MNDIIYMDNFESWCEAKGYYIDSSVSGYVISAWADDYTADLRARIAEIEAENNDLIDRLSEELKS